MGPDHRILNNHYYLYYFIKYTRCIIVITRPFDVSGVRGTARVPGGVFADLLANGVLTDDPLRRYNDVEYRWVSEDDWTYSVTFDGDYYYSIISTDPYNPVFD